MDDEFQKRANARWIDFFGNFEEVSAPPLPVHREPFSIWDDSWCDLTFLKQLSWFKDMKVPTLRDMADAGLANDWQLKVLWEEEEEEIRREERREWKQYLRLNPHLIVYRQKKKGRTARKRRAAWQRKFDEQFEAEIANHQSSTRFKIYATDDYDERMLLNSPPSDWIASFWLSSFVDDNNDYKMFIVDKSKEVFWPAEPIAKRSLGYELIEFMPQKPMRRWASLHTLDTLERERVTESATECYDALKLRRTKSETNLNSECPHWNLLNAQERHLYEEDWDLYIMLVECERQDEHDMCGDDFCYTF